MIVYESMVEDKAKFEYKSPCLLYNKFTASIKMAGTIDQIKEVVEYCENLDELFVFSVFVHGLVNDKKNYSGLIDITIYTSESDTFVPFPLKFTHMFY